jgi:hypothetical protein
MERRMASHSISVAKDYTRTPGPRYFSEGDFSGEGFRRCSCPRNGVAYRAGAVTCGSRRTAGYATSFLEEVFGGLYARMVHCALELLGSLDIKSEEEDYLVDDIQGIFSKQRLR